MQEYINGCKSQKYHYIIYIYKKLLTIHKYLKKIFEIMTEIKKYNYSKK